MRRSARRCAGYLTAAFTAVLATLALVGCGAAHHRVRRTTASLCIDVGLPRDAAPTSTAALVMSGIRAAIPSQGLEIRDDRVHICNNGYAGNGAGEKGTAALLASAVAAATDRRTIGYIGALSSAQATVADAVLGPAQIPLITPSAATPAATPLPRRAGVGVTAVVAPRRSTFALLPDSRAQTHAAQVLANTRGCLSISATVRTTNLRTPRCILEESPLCAGLPLAGGGAEPVLCVLAGSAAAPPAPAVSYGYSAAELLLDTLARTAAAGQNIANRAVVLAGLARAQLSRTPIGVIRFAAGGAILQTHYSVYTVKANGQLTLSGSVPTH